MPAKVVSSASANRKQLFGDTIEPLDRLWNISTIQQLGFLDKYIFYRELCPVSRSGPGSGSGTGIPKADGGNRGEIRNGERSRTSH